MATISESFEVIKRSWDKLNHIFAFFVLYLLLSLSFKNLIFYNKFLILILFGFTIEIIQYFIPNRDFSLFDILANSIGIFSAWLFNEILKKFIAYHN